MQIKKDLHNIQIFRNYLGKTFVITNLNKINELSFIIGT